MAGCGKKLQVFVPRGWDYREITVKCGNTSPHGSPYLCDKCEEIHAGRDWRREAIEAGEAWDENDY
jgi:hypothetical protein